MYNDSIMLSEEVAQKLFAIAEKSELQWPRRRVHFAGGDLAT